MLQDTDNNDANAIDLAILIMKIYRYMWKLRTMINLLIGFENLAETTPTWNSPRNQNVHIRMLVTSLKKTENT